MASSGLNEEILSKLDKLKKIADEEEEEDEENDLFYDKREQERKTQHMKSLEEEKKKQELQMKAEKQAKEYTLTLTYSTTANVEPKSREITTVIGIVQNYVVTKNEVENIVKSAQKAVESVSGSAGLIYLKPKEGSQSMNAISINMAGQSFQTTTPPDFRLTANNTDNNQFVADDALNIIGEALKNQTGYDTYFTDIKAIKKVIDTTTSVNKATFCFQFILNNENAISDEIKNIVDETSGLSIEITLSGGGWE